MKRWNKAVRWMIPAALAVCVLPFLPGDAVKIVAVSLLGYKLRPLVERYHLHQTTG